MSDLAHRLSIKNRWIITIAVMAATLMEVLDTTIVNVAFPHMQGSLGAGPDEITWTLTSYLISSAIFMPLTGFFTDRFGRKSYLFFSIVLFTLASALCGAAQSINQIVIFRLLQGIFGAGLVPLSQAILTDIFPENERGQAMAIWGVGVMVGPILGPALGGYITDVLSWRWTFYINLPFGILASFMVFHFVPDTEKKERRLDWVSLTSLALGVGSIQYVLDRGQQLDWFASLSIQILTALGLLNLFVFVIYSLKNKTNALFDLSIFQDRNFLLSSFLLILLSLGMYGSMIIQPQLLEVLLNYPVLTVGLIMMPRGIASMLSMMIVGSVIQRMDSRWLIVFGILLNAFGIYLMTFYSYDPSLAWLIWPLILQGFGLGLIFVPLSAIAFSTLPVLVRAEAAGLYSLLRSIGSSIGISITMTFLSRHIQMAWNQIGGHLQIYNPALLSYLGSWHLKASDPAALVLLGNELGKQALMLSYINTFAFVLWSFLIMLPFVFLLKRPTQFDPPEGLPQENKQPRAQNALVNH